MTLEYDNYIRWAPWTNVECLFSMDTFRLNLEIWVDIDPGTMRMNYCSSHEYSQNIIHPTIIPLLFNRSTIIENIDNVHNILLFKLAQFIIYTNINFNMFSKFLPMKVKRWRPMLNAKYIMNRNYAGE